MKKFFLIVICILGLSCFNTPTFADNLSTTGVTTQKMIEPKNSDKCKPISGKTANTDVKSGCCFKYGGVCGCFNGKTRCCSGETNDKCPCHTDTSNPEMPKTKTLDIPLS